MDFNFGICKDFDILLPFFINVNNTEYYNIITRYALHKYFIFELLQLELKNEHLIKNEEKITNIVKEYHNSVDKPSLILYLKKNYDEIIKNDFYVKILKDNFIFKIGDLDVTNMTDKWPSINNILFDNVFKNNNLYKNEYNSIKTSEQLDEIKEILPKLDISIVNIKKEIYNNILYKSEYIKIIKNILESKYISEEIKNYIRELRNEFIASEELDYIKKKLLIMKRFLELHIETDKKTLNIEQMMHLIQKEQNRLDELKNIKYKLDKILLIPVKKNSLV